LKVAIEVLQFCIAFLCQ